MKVITLAISAIALSAVSSLAMAQERAAGGSADLQMTWTSLKLMADQANDNAKIAGIAANDARSKADKVIACNAKQKLYAPEHPTKDADGCIAVFEPKDLRIKTATFSPGGSTCGSGAHTCAVDSTTTAHLCKQFGYAYATGVSNGKYSSPKNNYIGRWTGSRWQVFNAREDNRPMNSLTCQAITWE